MKPDRLAAYGPLLAEVRTRIQSARSRTALAVNSELIRLYWDIGRLIDARQQEEGWGAEVISRLAGDIRNDLPDVRGFSRPNIYRMLAFHRAYPNDPAFVSQAVRQTNDDPGPTSSGADTPMLAIPWGHHCLIVNKVKDPATRRWYIARTVDQGWSRSDLTRAIEREEHGRVGMAATNFERTLPADRAASTREVFKDPYLFDFLTLGEPFHEAELEASLVEHVERFLLELGQGFAFVGRQVDLTVDGEDFRLDLLFYHLRLRAYVVVELKVGAFRPEHTGQLNFYCSVVDDQLRHPADEKTIGLLLCQTGSRLVAEYALRDIDKPLGVSTYDLTRELPTGLTSVLPSIEEIEAELGGPPPEDPS
jgi:predicted nuclease of restriction endonuclease-like (RecB) superfamily